MFIGCHPRHIYVFVNFLLSVLSILYFFIFLCFGMFPFNVALSPSFSCPPCRILWVFVSVLSWSAQAMRSGTCAVFFDIIRGMKCGGEEAPDWFLALFRFFSLYFALFHFISLFFYSTLLFSLFLAIHTFTSTISIFSPKFIRRPGFTTGTTQTGQWLLQHRRRNIIIFRVRYNFQWENRKKIETAIKRVVYVCVDLDFPVDFCRAV